MDISADEIGGQTERGTFEEIKGETKARRSYRRKQPKFSRPKETDESETVIRVEENFKDNLPKSDKPRDPKVDAEEYRKLGPEADALANMLITTCNAFAVTAAGLEAQIQPQERALIEGGLKRSLRRATPKQIERFSYIMDPLMVGFGFILWGKRVIRINSLRQQQIATDTAQESSGINNAAPQVPPETLIPGTNGRVGVQEGEVQSTPVPDAIKGRWNNEL